MEVINKDKVPELINKEDVIRAASDDEIIKRDLICRDGKN